MPYGFENNRALKLNALVTLRNAVSPWLTILQGAPDGLEVPGIRAGPEYNCWLI